MNATEERTMNATADAYINSVLDRMPRDTPLRSQIALELRGHIAERLEQGMELEEVLHQLGDPNRLAESYLSAVPLEKTSAGDRILAKFVDVMASLLMVAPLVLLCYFVAPANIPRVTVVLFTAIAGGCLMLCVYTVIAESSTDQTFGKRMMGLRVVTETGTRISFGQALVRQLPLIFSVIWIDALFALFTERHQRAFEMLSKTRVVRVPRPAAS
jgi:uncharacterized RDD family membrane protein YckC